MNAPLRSAGADRSAPAIRPEASGAPTSGIVEVMSYGRGRPGLIPLWAGEGDLPTPEFICAAAARALADGETFYSWQRGLPEFRDALARYHGQALDLSCDPDRFTATVGGMHALQIAMRIVAGPGDEVIVPTPAWPNFEGAVAVSGAAAISLPMQPTPSGWVLNLDRLEAAVTPRTRALVVNSPSNPTGWTASLAELRQILDLARRHGIWIIADEIYGRFLYGDGQGEGSGRAASFHDVMDDEDRILFVQTFSKCWAMTGWRIGWLEAPAHLGPIIENLVQYSTSGVAAFLQRGAIAALEAGGSFAQSQIARARMGRDIVCDGLAATGAVALPRPPGAFYAFFSVPGYSDTRALAKRLIDETQVGLAPGSAFGDGGSAHLRLCFLRDSGQLAEATERLADWLRRNAN